MGINRVPENVPFAQIANSALRDQSLSFAARGILAYALSNRGEWRMTRDELRRMTPSEGQRSIQKALDELTKAGYRVIVNRRGDDGRFIKEVHWFHSPQQPTDRE